MSTQKKWWDKWNLYWRCMRVMVMASVLFCLAVLVSKFLGVTDFIDEHPDEIIWGLLAFCWLIDLYFSRLRGKKAEDNEKPHLKHAKNRVFAPVIFLLRPCVAILLVLIWNAGMLLSSQLFGDAASMVVATGMMEILGIGMLVIRSRRDWFFRVYRACDIWDEDEIRSVLFILGGCFALAPLILLVAYIAGWTSLGL